MGLFLSGCGIPEDAPIIYDPVVFDAPWGEPCAGGMALIGLHAQSPDQPGLVSLSTWTGPNPRVAEISGSIWAVHEFTRPASVNEPVDCPFPPCHGTGTYFLEPDDKVGQIVQLREGQRIDFDLQLPVGDRDDFDVEVDRFPIYFDIKIDGRRLLNKVCVERQDFKGSYSPPDIPFGLSP